MKSVYTVLIILILSSFAASQSFADDKKKTKKVKKKKVSVSLLSVSQKLNDLKADDAFYALNKSTIAERWFPIMKEVREGRLGKDGAIDSMYDFTNDLWEFLQSRVESGKLKKYSDQEWVFPVKGYNSGVIGGNRGSGYVPGNFDFFDLNTGGHPAHDIFINDVNQDCVDDFTGEDVKILSMSGGVVVETRKNWTPEMMDIKGGNIVYVYDNFTNGLFYYAHLKDVYVNVGDLVVPGTELGSMGRTGKNAYPSRSPTHLHIMYVRSFDGDLRPEDIYADLVRVKTIK